MISLSIRNGAELRTSIPFFPESFELDHFKNLFKQKNFGNVILNSLQISLISLTRLWHSGLAVILEILIVLVIAAFYIRNTLKQQS